MGVDNKVALLNVKAEPPQSQTSRPGRGRPTRAQSERRSKELLDRALDLFLERGFDGTTIEAIVDSAGMGRKTVYAHFGDKMSLFKAALQGAIDDLVIPADHLRATERPDLYETLLNVARTISASMRSEGGHRLMRLAHAELIQRPEIWSYYLQQTTMITVVYLTDLLERRLELQNASDAAMAFYLLVIDGSYRSQVWFDHSEEEIQRQIRYQTQIFVDGICSSAAGEVPA